MDAKTCLALKGAIDPEKQHSAKWISVRDGNDQPYFFNETTKESAWEKPRQEFLNAVSTVYESSGCPGQMAAQQEQKDQLISYMKQKGCVFMDVEITDNLGLKAQLTDWNALNLKNLITLPTNQASIFGTMYANSGLRGHIAFLQTKQEILKKIFPERYEELIGLESVEISKKKESARKGFLTVLNTNNKAYQSKVKEAIILRPDLSIDIEGTLNNGMALIFGNKFLQAFLTNPKLDILSNSDTLIQDEIYKDLASLYHLLSSELDSLSNEDDRRKQTLIMAEVEVEDLEALGSLLAEMQKNEEENLNPEKFKAYALAETMAEHKIEELQKAQGHNIVDKTVRGNILASPNKLLDDMTKARQKRLELYKKFLVILGKGSAKRAAESIQRAGGGKSRKRRRRRSGRKNPKAGSRRKKN